MNKNFRPVIIIVAYNRTHTLQRILSSLSKAVCPEGTKLIISIDNSGDNQAVAEIADQYKWKLGEKEVIYHKEHMGMRKHYNFCGDLSYQYGSVIMVEDDMVVSPHFYKFARESLNYYQNSDEIAGISLYNLPYAEASKLPFIPLTDDSDIYFLQIPSSLTMTYTVEQWDNFRRWFDLNPDLTKINGLPMIVSKYWSKSSWKKYMYGYMVLKNKFFVYPQISYSSNFNDLGTNMVNKTFVGQVGLQMVYTDIKFKSVEDSVNVYDAYSEIMPGCINDLCHTLTDYNYEVDLYGRKESFVKDFVLTTKSCAKYIMGFERSMKPHELNVIYNIQGKEIFLARKEDVLFYPSNRKHLKYNRTTQDFINEYTYFYNNVFDTTVLMKIFRFRIKNKIEMIFNK